MESALSIHADITELIKIGHPILQRFIDILIIELHIAIAPAQQPGVGIVVGNLAEFPFRTQRPPDLESEVIGLAGGRPVELHFPIQWKCLKCEQGYRQGSIALQGAAGREENIFLRCLAQRRIMVAIAGLEKQFPELSGRVGDVVISGLFRGKFLGDTIVFRNIHAEVAGCGMADRHDTIFHRGSRLLLTGWCFDKAHREQLAALISDQQRQGQIGRKSAGSHFCRVHRKQPTPKRIIQRVHLRVGSVDHPQSGIVAGGGEAGQVGGVIPLDKRLTLWIVDRSEAPLQQTIEACRERIFLPHPQAGQGNPGGGWITGIGVAVVQILPAGIIVRPDIAEDLGAGYIESFPEADPHIGQVVEAQRIIIQAAHADAQGIVVGGGVGQEIITVGIREALRNAVGLGDVHPAYRAAVHRHRLAQAPPGTLGSLVQHIAGELEIAHGKFVAPVHSGADRIRHGLPALKSAGVDVPRLKVQVPVAELAQHIRHRAVNHQKGGVAGSGGEDWQIANVAVIDKLAGFGIIHLAKIPAAAPGKECPVEILLPPRQIAERHISRGRVATLAGIIDHLPGGIVVLRNLQLRLGKEGEKKQ